MSGHAILDSCHNCGKANTELFVVSVSKTSLSCGEVDEEGKEYHHVHVAVACTSCKINIWEAP